MAIKISQVGGNANSAVKVVATCDDCGVTATPPANPRMGTKDQLRDTTYPNKQLINDGWHMTPNGKNHRCPSCVAEFNVVVNDSSNAVVDNSSKASYTKLDNGRTKCGVDVFLDGEATNVILMENEIGAQALAEAMGVSTTTIRHITQKGTTGGHVGTKVRKIYDLAAEALMLREELKAKNEMLDRAQDRANEAEQQASELSESNARLRELNTAQFATNKQLITDNKLLNEVLDRANDQISVLEANRVGNVSPSLSLKETIKSYFSRNAFQLTIDDLTMLDKTLRQVGTEE